MNTGQNVDPRELAHFDALAARWWDPDGDLHTLHAINPVRTEYIAGRMALAGTRVLDIGCGGGLLAEALAARGARVTGIDASAEAVAVARLHLHESGYAVEYAQGTAEQWAESHPGEYDLVTCLELIEHVPDPQSLVQACARLVRPGGALCVSTLNRTPRAWLLAVLGAEYVLGLLPRGTHDYARFVRPSELDAWARDAGLRLDDTSGLRYEPGTRSARLAPDDIRVNYLAWFTRTA